MSASDYTSSGGGALKLKGNGVDKKQRKKKKPRQTVEDAGQERALTKGLSSVQDALAHEDRADDDGGNAPVTSKDELSEELKRDLVEYKGKTEAERRHEERRRQRLHERLKREGVKTHKERVEELNRYLSAQSDHHDMPKIGPG